MLIEVVVRRAVTVLAPSGAMTPTHITRTGRISLATNLVAEWQRMARQPHNIRRANSLGLPGEPVTHLQEMLLRSGLDDTTNANHFDEYLARLVECAKADDLATRMVFQRIMPGLISMAMRRAPLTVGGLSSAFDLIASAAWIVIRRFPIDRRPRRVAANLLMDIEYQAFVREPRLKRNRTEFNFAPGGLLGIEFERFRRGQFDDDPVGNGAYLDLLFYEFEKHGLTENDLQILRAICHDINSVEIAPHLNIKPRSVRNRRERAINKAREVLIERDDLQP